MSTPFRVTACQALKFEPKFTAGTTGKTSKAERRDRCTSSLTYPTGALGNDANIKYVKVDFPKACRALDHVAKGLFAEGIPGQPGQLSA